MLFLFLFICLWYFEMLFLKEKNFAFYWVYKAYFTEWHAKINSYGVALEESDMVIKVTLNSYHGTWGSNITQVEDKGFL